MATFITVELLNITAGNLTFGTSPNTLTVNANSSANLTPQTAIMYSSVLSDPNLTAAMGLNSINVSDGVTSYSTGAAINYVTNALNLSLTPYVSPVGITYISGTLDVNNTFGNQPSGDAGPILVAGATYTGSSPGTFAKVPISCENISTDGIGNSIYGLAVYDYNLGTPTAFGGAAPLIPGQGTFTNGSGDQGWSPQAPVIMLDVSGTFTGYITVQQQIYINVETIPLREIGTGTVITSITAPGIYSIEGISNQSDINFHNVISTGTCNIYGLSGAGFTTGQYTYQAGTWITQIKDSSGNNLNSTSGSLNVNITGGSSGSNAAAGPTGAAVPTDASYTGYNSSGNLVGVSTSNPLPVAQQGNVAVTGTFWQSTQPVSGTVTANAGTGTFTVSGTVTANAGTNLNTSALALESGGNLASIKSDTDNLALSQGSTTSGQKGNLNFGAVTTSPPSYSNAQSSPFSLTTAGALRVDGSSTTQPVSGTFWQATQPVSGTFWQATQPVSGTVTANAGTNLNTSALALDTSVNGLLLTQGSTTGGEKGPLIQGAVTTAAPSYSTSQTSPLSLNISGGLRVDGSGVTQPISGTVTANAGTGTFTVSATNLQTNINQFGGSAILTGTGASGVGIPRVTVSNDSNILVTPPTLTKGTQSSTGFSVQELKDAGRNVSNFFMVLPVVTTSTDTLQSLTGYKSGAAVGATTTPAVVTTGKTYRINSITLTYVAIATAGTAAFTLRANNSGTVAIGSPAVSMWYLGAPAATAGISQSESIDFPDGLEFAAGTGIGISVQGRGATQTAAAVGYAQIAVYGFEY